MGSDSEEEVFDVTKNQEIIDKDIDNVESEAWSSCCILMMLKTLLIISMLLIQYQALRK